MHADRYSKSFRFIISIKKSFIKEIIYLRNQLYYISSRGKNVEKDISSSWNEVILSLISMLIFIRFMKYNQQTFL